MSESHEYWSLCSSCNQKTGCLGYLKEWGQDVGEDGGGRAQEGLVRKQQPETVPSYTLDEWDDIPTLEA
jgi:hypothetical protein